MNGGPSETVEFDILLATSVLDADNIPNQNQSETCFSCGSTMQGLYCKDCGQKNDNFRRSIFFLIIEAFTSIFSLESRIWKTWLSLIRNPGKASREFADGKRTVWTSPVRIYLAMSIVLFGYMSLTDTRLISVRTDIEAREGVIGDVETLNDNQVRLSPEVLFFARQKRLDDLNEDVNFDRIERLIKGVPDASFSLAEDETLDVILSTETALQDFTRGFIDGASGATTRDSKTDSLDYKLFQIGQSKEFTEDLLEEIEDLTDDLEDKTSDGTTGLEDDNADPIKTSESDDQDPELLQSEDERQAIKLALAEKNKAIRQLNRLLDNYADIQDVAKGLADETIPLTTDALTRRLPGNLTVEKRTEVIENIATVISDLNTVGITGPTLSDLTLDIDMKGMLFFNSMTLNGTKLDSGQIQKVSMTALKEPEVLNEAFATYLPRIMFLMMPFAMFAGIIYIRGKKTALMYDHLVHAAYIHAFTYFFLLLLIILSQWAGLSNLGSVFLWGMLIYLPISAKYMFQRGWFKTLLTSYSIALQYSIVIFFIMLALLGTQMNKTISGI